MRRTDVHPSLHPHLVKCDSHPHCHALVAPPTPRRLPADPAVDRAVTEAMQALERVRTAVALLPNSDMVTRTLARREAVQSSQIEGTRTQVHELLEYEATQSGAGLPPDAAVTQRYVQALEHGLDRIRAVGSRRALDNRLVLHMHAILLQDAPAQLRPGSYRDIQAWIGSGRIEDASFVPAPPSAIPDCMEDLERAMLQYAPRDDEPWVLPVVAQVAIAHAQFETIHPFVDGNGRAGRLLIPLILAAEGYPPLYLSGELLRHKRAYYDALADVQLRADWVPWTTLLARAIVQASDGAIAIATDMNALASDWAARLTGIRRDATVHQMPRYLLGHPVVTIAQVAKAFSISFPAASRAVGQLVDREILREPSRRRDRVFHATELLARLARE